MDLDIIDLAYDPAWHEAIYGSRSREEVRRLNAFLRDNPDRFIRLFHGTRVVHPVMEKGLLPTTTNRRNSYQSANGFVCLSVYPGMAYDFGNYAALNGGGDAEGNRVAVYAVTVCLRRLLADRDQLNNRRAAGTQVGNSLAESLIFGSGARVKGGIEPFSLREIGRWPCNAQPQFSLAQIAPEKALPPKSKAKGLGL